MKKLFSILLVAIAFTSTSIAQTAKTWNVDKMHSAVKFTVSHLVISEVDGSFKIFDGNLVSTKDDFTDATSREDKKSTLKTVKVKVAKPTVKKVTTNKKVPGSKGRKSLNTQWDRIVSDNMGTKENPKTSNELLQDLVNARDKKYILDEGNTKLIQRLNASLTKLYKQNKIGKQKIEGKKAFVYFSK
jgi:hypothetical protein